MKSTSLSGSGAVVSNVPSSTHTPTPWFRSGDSIETSEGYAIASTDLDWSSLDGSCDEANAAHIVRCVNSHDDLVAALQAVDDEWSEFWPKGPDVPESHDRTFAIGASTALIWKSIRAALAKAKRE